MSTFSWNCHGLGTPWPIQFLKECLHQKNPILVFLSETLCKQETVEKVQNILMFEGAILVDSQGHSGGLAMLWRNGNKVQVMSYRKNHIDVLVEIKGWNKFRLTGLYGEPDCAKRKETWELIRGLQNLSTMP